MTHGIEENDPEENDMLYKSESEREIQIDSFIQQTTITVQLWDKVSI